VWSFYALFVVKFIAYEISKILKYKITMFVDVKTRIKIKISKMLNY
jgi:hypothetical protein